MTTGTLVCLAGLCGLGWAGTGRAAAPRAPTFPEVAYGSDQRQVMDVYTVASAKPAPWVFYIHGGGWQAGDKDSVRTFGLEALLESGLAVVTIRYRFLSQAQAAGVTYPLEWPTRDARRALQFARTQASAWNLDPVRVAAAGGSAGAVSALWLALHDDMADPSSDDVVERQSTRLWCVAVTSAQTSLDPQQFRSWVPNASYGAPAFGFPEKPGEAGASFYRYLAARDRLLPVIREYSAYDLLSADDPPIHLEYFVRGKVGEPATDAAHVDVHGIQFVKRAKEIGVPAELVYPTADQPKFAQTIQFLRQSLRR